MSDKQATRQAYGKALVEIGRENPNLVVMDADLSKSTMTAEFAKAFPDRFFNMGIAEQDLYGAACGLALSGKVVCASTFAMFAAGRAFEIIRNSIGYTRANVKGKSCSPEFLSARRLHKAGKGQLAAPRQQRYHSGKRNNGK